jgi:carbon-monoxide dehydrogenase medium subunit
MKPAPFRYFAPETVDEAVGLLREHGDDAKVLAGGQSLVPMMNLRLAQPAVLVDVNRIPALAYVRDDDGHTAIGATTRHHEVTGSDLVAAAQPLLRTAATFIGYPAIRRRGTIGGSIAHADPVAEMPCVALALDAELVAAGPLGRRRIPAREFFLGYFTTALAPDEVLVEVRIPRRNGGGWAFQEFSRRSGDFAIVAVAVTVSAVDGGIDDARIAIAGVADTPVRADEAEAALRGRPPEAAVLGEARAAVERLVEDGYRRHVAGTLAVRALAEAVAAAGLEMR